VNAVPAFRTDAEVVDEEPVWTEGVTDTTTVLQPRWKTVEFL
jgi:hypothetical protein